MLGSAAVPGLSPLNSTSSALIRSRPTFAGLCVPAGVYMAESVAMSLSCVLPSGVVNLTFEATSGITIASGC